ncbi:hypothetical protein L3X38_004127 [Prunus dulcis]|uniref:Reverse transcriptase domain-containing protein n=1 Tax=Prunus dulcis TaxID=3755 RepID=A0AAD4ZNG3_PRUDU|nr:hypothetical protein L3X38_004127 [Prunus dulcis]
MPGIDPQIICHRVHVNPAIKPVAQKRRNFTLERVAIIEVKIDKLIAAVFIEEVSYAEWLANVVHVAKKDKGLWRVCLDYTDLNKEQIGKTMEVYVDDMLVKALERANHIKNLVEAFSLLRKYNMKLNPSKCMFGVSSRRFLGYLVTQRGI